MNRDKATRPAMIVIETLSANDDFRIGKIGETVNELYDNVNIPGDLSR